MTITIITEVVRNLTVVLLFLDFSKAFDSVNRAKKKQILLVYGISQGSVSVIMMLYKNTETCVDSPDGTIRRYSSSVLTYLFKIIRSLQKTRFDS